MASQPTLRPGPPPVDRWAHPLVDPRQADRDALHFPEETYPLLTGFRENVINYIYLTARDFSEGTLTSASVEMSDEDDVPVLDLTLVVDGDWAFIQALQHKVLTWLSRWAQEWTAQERADYSQHIYFGLIPKGL